MRLAENCTRAWAESGSFGFAYDLPAAGNFTVGGVLNVNRLLQSQLGGGSGVMCGS